MEGLLSLIRMSAVRCFQFFALSQSSGTTLRRGVPGTFWGRTVPDHAGVPLDHLLDCLTAYLVWQFPQQREQRTWQEVPVRSANSQVNEFSRIWFEFLVKLDECVARPQAIQFCFKLSNDVILVHGM